MAGESDTIVGAGVIASILTLTLGALTKYLLDRRKMGDEHESSVVQRLHERIEELEAANQECMRRDAEQSKRIGYLEAKCEAMEQQLNDMRGQK
jgi:TolA-binding protein